MSPPTLVIKNILKITCFCLIAAVGCVFPPKKKIGPETLGFFGETPSMGSAGSGPRYPKSRIFQRPLDAAQMMPMVEKAKDLLRCSKLKK